MTKTLKLLALGASLPVLMLVDLSPEAPLGVDFARNAMAIVGAPLTPGSAAGVARRTTRRVVAVSATSAAAASNAAAASAPPPPPPPQQSTGPVPIGTVVSTLPAGCVATAINGIEYFNCAPGVYYRAAFQSNNLVYVATQP